MHVGGVLVGTWECANDDNYSLVIVMMNVKHMLGLRNIKCHQAALNVENYETAT